MREGEGEGKSRRGRARSGRGVIGGGKERGYKDLVR